MKASAHKPCNNALRVTSSLCDPAASTPRNKQRATGLPAISPGLLRAFSAYSRWYVSRAIHSVRISRAGSVPSADGLPLVIYANHASWWDPLVGLTLQNALFASRPSFAPIDLAALNKYRFFARLGFFGVEQNSPRGAKHFIRTAEAILNHSDSILWLTPQGRFADVRERPVRFKAGLGHLPRHIKRAAFVPLAIEYSHWEERLPEAICRFGPVDLVGSDAGFHSIDDVDCTRHFERQLATTQDALATEVQRRRKEDFEIILQGRGGVGFAYDIWRAVRSALSGQKFQPEHGNL
jgi:1-acyl-sn-glycerol-3-phosphate acyltransferase